MFSEVQDSCQRVWSPTYKVSKLCRKRETWTTSYNALVDTVRSRRRRASWQRDKSDWVAEAVVSVLAGILTADWTLAGIGKGVLGGLGALALYEFILRPIRHFIFTVPVEINDATLREQDEARRQSHQELLALERRLSDRDAQIESLTSQVVSIARTAPNLVCVGQKWIPLHFGRNRIYRFHALSVWIGNQPVVRGEPAVARRVSVRVTVRDRNRETTLHACVALDEGSGS